MLRAIKKIATTGLKTGCPISVCGDAVAEEAMLVFFVGVGIRAFSVDPRLLTMVRARLMNMDTKEAEETAHTMLNFRMNRDVKNYLESIKN